MRLGDIADIYMGCHFASSIQPDIASPHRVLQLKDVSGSGEIKVPAYGVKLLSEPKLKYFLKKDDVLFLARTRLQAVHVDQNFKNLIVSSQFFLIRTKKESYSSQYLAWYLNQVPAQKYFAQYSEGTGILSIKLNELCDLPVVFVPEEKQKKLLALNDLKRRYLNLTKEHEIKLNQLINSMSNQILCS